MHTFFTCFFYKRIYYISGYNKYWNLFFNMHVSKLCNNKASEINFRSKKNKFELIEKIQKWENKRKGKYLKKQTFFFLISVLWNFILMEKGKKNWN